MDHRNSQMAHGISCSAEFSSASCGRPDRLAQSRWIWLADSLPIPILQFLGVGLEWPMAANAWPNYLITTLALFAVMVLACRRGYSPLGILSAPADRIFVE